MHKKPGWIGSVLLLCAAASAAAAPPTASDPFPTIEELRPAVGFWRSVFGVWSLGQVAVHDHDYPNLVYEVVDLPGPAEQRYTEEQREYSENLRDAWADRLRRLQDRVLSGDALDESERALIDRIVAAGGSEALRDADRRVRTQRGLRQRFGRGIEVSKRYEERLRSVFRDAGLPEDLALLPHVESSFQWSARSRGGAVGAWQFTRGTGRLFMKITSAVDERLDPVIAAHAAAAYLQRAHERLGDWPVALTSYNHGIAGMQRAVERHGADLGTIVREYRGRSFGFASRNFYAEFLAAREIAANVERFFPEGLDYEQPDDHVLLELDRPASPARLARAAGLPLDELAAINPAWTPRGLSRGLALPKGARIWVPRSEEQLLSRLSAAGQTHRVRRGESLSRIAEAYGLSLEQLRALNGLSASRSVIHPDQLLVVAEGGEDVVHVVSRGDTLLRIARDYGVALVELLATNRLSRRSTIYPGQEIRIPLE